MWKTLQHQMVPSVFLVLMLAVVAPTHGLPTCPPGGSYFDEHTNRRECCEGLCKYANDDNSKQLCKLKCPGTYITFLLLNSKQLLEEGHRCESLTCDSVVFKMLLLRHVIVIP